MGKHGINKFYILYRFHSCTNSVIAVVAGRHSRRLEVPDASHVTSADNYNVNKLYMVIFKKVYRKGLILHIFQGCTSSAKHV